MDESIREAICRQVVRVVSLLVDGNYCEVERLSSARRLTASQIQAGVEDYGKHLKMLPEGALREIDVVAVRGATPRQFSVRVPLHTVEEGRSDLSLELTLFVESAATNSLRVEVDGVYVM